MVTRSTYFRLAISVLVPAMVVVASPASALVSQAQDQASKGGFKAGKALADTVKVRGDDGAGQPQVCQTPGASPQARAGDPLPGIGITVNQWPPQPKTAVSPPPPNGPRAQAGCAQQPLPQNKTGGFEAEYSGATGGVVNRSAPATPRQDPGEYSPSAKSDPDEN